MPAVQNNVHRRDASGNGFPAPYNIHMLLVCDIGNSNIVFGLYEDDELRASWRLTSRLNATVDEYTVSMGALLARHGSALGVKAAILSSVVPPLTPKLEQVISGQEILDMQDLVEMVMPQVGDDEPLALEIQDFIQSVQGKKKPEVPGEAGVRALAIAAEIVKNINSRLELWGD